MSDQSSGAAPQGGQAEGVVGNQLIINAQYVKDLSFENPRAPQTLMQASNAPEVQIGVDVKANSLGGEVYEVLLTIAATAKSGEETVFVAELTYGAVVTVRNTPQELIPVLVLVETPRIIFPFARAIISDATRDGGFPPLLLHPIDFAELARRQHGAPSASAPAVGNA